MNHTQAKLVDRIADTWGDRDGDRSPTAKGDRVMFSSDDGSSRFVIVLPGARTRRREHTMRPFPARIVPTDKVLVQCVDDAADCWWYVHLDGTYVGMDGLTRRVLLP